MGEGLGIDGLAAEGTGRSKGVGDLRSAWETCVVLVGTQHHGRPVLAVKLRGTDFAGETVTFLSEGG